MYDLHEVSACQVLSGSVCLLLFSQWWLNRTLIIVEVCDLCFRYWVFYGVLRVRFLFFISYVCGYPSIYPLVRPYKLILSSIYAYSL
jgi:hypothetical protein